MKSIKLFLVASLLGLIVSSASGQKVEVIHFDQLEQIIQRKSEKIKVINFWATWCKPCVKEIPYFENVNALYKEDIKVILVSFDFVSDIKEKVLPFIRKRNITADVKVLDETDFNAFIDKIHPSWSGAIPATLIVSKKGEKTFYEKQFAEGELEELIKNQISR